MVGGEGMSLIQNHRHAELVSASIAPHAQTLQAEAAGAVCASNASARTDGWTLKRVQGDDDFEAVG
jgi:hypothetical protein